MAGLPQDIQWYIARDGAQHGPISDAEMKKFVELGHLRPADLVWCPQFPQWRTGGEVFPQVVRQSVAAAEQTAQPSHEPATPNGVQPAATDTAPQQQRVQASTAEMTLEGPAQNGSRHPSGSIISPTSLSVDPSLDAQIGTAAQPGGTFDLDPGVDVAAGAVRQPPMASPDGRGREPEFRNATTAHSGAAPNAHQDPSGLGPSAVRPNGSHAAAQQAAPADGTMALGPAPRDDRSTALASQGRDDDDEWEDNEQGRRPWLGRTAAIVATLLIVGGMVWIGLQSSAVMNGVSSIQTKIVRGFVPTSSSTLYHTSPFVAAGQTEEEVDTSLQQTAVWQLLKREFPNWYTGRVQDVVRMRSQQQDEKAISKFLADVIVVLRRKHGQTALQASPEHLKRMAGSFVTNLKQLATRDAKTCFGFVSFGLANAFMLELTKTSAFAEPLQRQIISIFESIANARKKQNIHPATSRADYDKLTIELKARGWTQDDLAIFSNPQRLSSSPPEKVCRMVQEWFTAQLALKDPQLQARLLAESLKPLVFG